MSATPVRLATFGFVAGGKLGFGGLRPRPLLEILTRERLICLAVDELCYNKCCEKYNTLIENKHSIKLKKVAPPLEPISFATNRYTFASTPVGTSSLPKKRVAIWGTLGHIRLPCVKGGML